MRNNQMTKGEVILGYGSFILAFIFIFPIHEYFGSDFIYTFLVLQPVIIWTLLDSFKRNNKQENGESKSEN